MDLPKTNSSIPSSVNAESLITLQSMGFPENRCIQALKESNSNVEVAIGILFSKASDPTYGLSKPASSKSNQTTPLISRKGVRESELRAGAGVRGGNGAGSQLHRKGV